MTRPFTHEIAPVLPAHDERAGRPMRLDDSGLPRRIRRLRVPRMRRVRAAFDGRGVVHRGFPAWLKEDGEKLTLLYWAYEGYEERHHRPETHASKP